MTGFETWWKTWPASPRKGSKSECLKRWIKHHHESQADTIVAHTKYLKTTMGWFQDNGAYIPAPLVYLNQQRWDGADIPPEKPEIDREAIYQRQLAASIAAMK